MNKIDKDFYEFCGLAIACIVGGLILLNILLYFS